MSIVRTALLVACVAIIAACRAGARAIVAGEDSCRYCRMTIDDPRFGALVETARGRTETFDAIECLTSFVVAQPASAAPKAIWVADYATPSRWLDATRARYLYRSRVQSPMGRTLVAFGPEQSATDLVAQYGGRVVSWSELPSLVTVADNSTPTALATVASRTHHTVQDTVIVAPDGSAPGGIRRLTDAVTRVARGGVVHVRAGIYREPTVLVQQPMSVIGDSGAVLDGEDQRDLMVVGADSVTVRGMTFRNTGTSQATDRSALRFVEANSCVIENNRFERTLFGIYLQRVASCLVRRNVLDGMEGSQTVTGNGLHLWASRDVILEDNIIRGHRDGIYFEFVTNGIVRRNVSVRSRRYGLHFMFSDSCHYEQNTFAENTSGVAVMYSHRVHIVDNRFERNLGSAAYGLLLKEITDSEVRGNKFIENSVALHLESASRNAVIDNDFVRNGWAVRVLADAQDNVLRGNLFSGNVFDVGTNSLKNYSTFNGNWWDRYQGYDLDHNGIGDVPHAPVRLFALLVQQSPPALVLTRSVLVDVLDVAERVAPVLTPETLRDAAPLMRAPRTIP